MYALVAASTMCWPESFAIVGACAAGAFVVWAILRYTQGGAQ